MGKTHDLGRLLELATPIQPGFDRFADAADILSGYVALTRYPDDGAFIPSSEEAEEAIRAAEEIRAFVEAGLGL